MKTATLSEFLTPEEIKRAISLYGEARAGTFATRCEAEIVKPSLARINTALGQENNARFVAYAIEFAITEAFGRVVKRPPAP